MTKNSRKWLLNAVNGVLTLGASLTLGLLSFGGFYAIYPSIKLGLSSFSLATLYEGEIYNSNIKDALSKLLKRNYFKRQQATNTINTLLEKFSFEQLPQFFKDYQTLETEINRLNHRQSNSLALEIAKYKAKKELKLMQRFFSKALFNEPLTEEEYAAELITFLSNIDNGKFQKSIKIKTENKKFYIKAGLYFSLLSAALFSIGSVYLILETLTTLTFISLSLPVILSLSAVCGAAYGLLTYNSLADLVWNETISSWLEELKTDIKKGNILKIIPSLVLITLAACLTVFTAGTWITIGKHSKNLPLFLKKIPAFITNILIPTIISAATLAFTLENTKSSLDRLMYLFGYKKTESNHEHNHSDLKQEDSRPTYQKYNPFNAIIFCIESPLRMIGFILHIASIGVTTDRINGVPKFISAGLSMLSEGFEDYHYFVGQSECEDHADHNHSNDIPTKLIRFALSPLYAFSSCWHWAGSQLSSKKVDFGDAWQERFKSNELANTFVNLFIKQEESTTDLNDNFKSETSTQWQQQKLLMQLNDQLCQINGEDKLTQEKREILETIKINIKVPGSKVYEHLNINASSKAKLSQHRSFWHIPGEKTSSTEFIETLQSQVTQAKG